MKEVVEETALPTPLTTNISLVFSKFVSLSTGPFIKATEQNHIPNLSFPVEFYSMEISLWRCMMKKLFKELNLSQKLVASNDTN